MKQSVRKSHKRKLDSGRITQVRTHLLNISSPMLRIGKDKYYLDRKKNRLRKLGKHCESVGYSQTVNQLKQRLASKT